VPKASVLELEDEADARDFLEDIERAIEEGAMNKGWTLTYAKLLAVQLFTPDELRVGLGMIN
jgi:hypothetical protein